MRIIPKNTKVKSTIWKGYSLLDCVIAFFMLVAVFLIVISNIPHRFILAIVIAVFSVIMLFPTTDNQLVYQDFIQAIKFLCSRKKFEKNLDKNTKKGNDISILVPYTNLKDNGIIEYPGYVARVISIGQKEFGLETEYKQELDIRAISKIFQALDIRQAMDLVKIDRPIIFDDYIKDIEKQIEEHKDIQNKVIRDNILRERAMQYDYLNTQEKLYRPFFYLVIYDQDEDVVINTSDLIKSYIAEAGLEAKELSTKEIAIFLKYCQTRNFDEREIENIDPKDYLDWIIPKKMEFKGSSYYVDDVETFTFAIEDYPLQVLNAWGSELFNIQNTKIVMHVTPVDQYKAIKRVDKVVTELFSREDLVKASEELEKETHLETMKELLTSLQNDNESLSDVVITVTGYNYDKKQSYDFRKQIRQKIQTKGFRLSNCWNRQLEAFITSNISRKSELRLYERGINSSTLGAIFPFVNTAIMDRHGILLGNNDFPTIINFWKRDTNFQNSNAMVLGRSGSGKSYFIKTLLTQMYAEDVSLFILDPENEYTVLATNIDGKIIDVGNATEGRLNPFQIYQILTEEGKSANPETIFYSHLRTLESFFRIILEGISSEVLEIINNYVVEAYKKKGITHKTDVSNFKPEDFPIFDDLLLCIQKDVEKEKSELMKQNLYRAENYIKKFTTGGRYSDLWNHPSTLETNDEFTVFNFQSLFANKNNIVANAQMLLIFRFLEQKVINIREENTNAANNKIKHVAIFADEAHLFIDPKYPIALDFFFQMVKRIRKYNGMFMPITQSVADWNASKELNSKTTAILKNTQYNFVFSLNPQDIEDLVNIYKSGSPINETEQNIISGAGVGQTFFIGSNCQRTVFQVNCTDYVQDLFTVPLIKSEEETEEPKENSQEEPAPKKKKKTQKKK